MAPRSLITTEEAAYEEAVAMLTRKPRTAHEVSEALQERGADDGTIESVLGRLKAHRHIDDSELAHDEAFVLLDEKGLAPAAAVQTLLVRGIPGVLASEAVESAREGRTELELCRVALEKRLGSKRLDKGHVGKESRALARLGYEGEVVERAIEQALAGARESDDAQS